MDLAAFRAVPLGFLPRLQQLLEVLNQLRQFGLTPADRVVDPRPAVLAACAVLSLVVAPERPTGAVIACGRYAVIACGWYKRRGQIVDDLFGPLRDPCRYRLSRHPRWYRPAFQPDLGRSLAIRRTCGAHFQHDAMQEAGHGQPKRGNE